MQAILCRPLLNLIAVREVAMRLFSPKLWSFPRLSTMFLPLQTITTPLFDAILQTTTFKRKVHKMRKHKRAQRKKKMRKMIERMKKYEKRK